MATRTLLAVFFALLTLGPQLRVHGTRFVDETGRPYIPRWVSGLTLLSRTPAQQQAYLDWAVQTGFNGVRVFAGALTWARQTPQSARRGLPGLLDRAAARGLAVEVTALTDTATGYDARSHLEAIVEVVSGRPGVVLELANEVGHPSQSNLLTAERLRSWGREIADPRGIVWAVGAASTDRLEDGRYATEGGTYITIHLDRGGDMWPQIARAGSFHLVAAKHGVPVLNNEPMGADERDGDATDRQRWNDPAAFFALGALDRASGFGGVHHSQAGLMAELPGPVQQRCAEAYVAGHRAVESVLGDAATAFVEPGRPGAPMESVIGLPAAQILAFVGPTKAVVILVGAPADRKLRWAPGWQPGATVRSMAGQDGRRVEVLEASRQLRAVRSRRR